MKKGILWRIILIIITVIAAVIFFLPNTPLFQHMPDWWTKNMPGKGIVLGLDLQGGLHLVFEVEGDKAVVIATDRAATLIASALQRKSMQGTVKREGPFIIVTPADSGVRKVVEDMYPSLSLMDSADALKYGFSTAEAQKIKDAATDQVLEIIRNRIDQFGVAEPTILRQGANEIVVQLPGVKDPKRAVDIIGKTAQLEFKLVDTESPVAAELPSKILPGEEAQFIDKFKSRIHKMTRFFFIVYWIRKPISFWKRYHTF